MSTDIILTQDSENAALAAIAAKVDAGASAGELRVLTGSDDLLVTFACQDPAFTNVGVGEDFVWDTDSGSEQAVATGTGTAAKAELRDSDNNLAFWGSVTVIGGGGFCQTDKEEIEIGDTVTVQSLKLEPQI